MNWLELPKADIGAARNHGVRQSQGRYLIASIHPLAPHPYLQEGQRVRVVRGSLEGATGIFLRRQHLCRLVLSVQLIQQAVSVEIDAADIVPLMS